VDEYSKLIYGLVGVGVAAFVGYVFKTLGNHNTRLAVLETKDENNKGMKKSLDKLTEIVFEIAGKLGIPIRGD
jgi:hypothetical protein